MEGRLLRRRWGGSSRRLGSFGLWCRCWSCGLGGFYFWSVSLRSSCWCRCRRFGRVGLRLSLGGCRCRCRSGRRSWGSARLIRSRCWSGSRSRSCWCGSGRLRGEDRITLLVVVLLRDQRGEHQSDDEKCASKPARAFLQNVRGLGSPHLVGHTFAEGCAEAFLTRALHEDDKNEEQANQHLNNGEQRDKKVHTRGAEYAGTPALGKLVLQRRDLSAQRALGRALDGLGHDKGLAILGLHLGIRGLVVDELLRNGIKLEHGAEG